MSREPVPETLLTEVRPSGGSVSERAPKLSIYAEMMLLGLIFGVSPVASKYAAEGFPVLLVATLRVIIGSLAFIPVVNLVERRWIRPTRPEVGWFAVLGATGFLIFGGLYFLGLQHTTASHAVIVFGAGLMVTAFLSALILRYVVIGEKFDGIVYTFVGILVIDASSGANLAAGSVFGDLALLGAITSWSFYSIYAKRLMPRFGPILVTAYSVMAGAVLLLPLSLLLDFRPTALTSAPVSAWLGILFTGLVSTVIAYILWNRGVKYLGPTLTSVFMNVSPVWGFLTAYALRGEEITLWHLVSGVLVVGGVSLANWTGLKQAVRRA